jgi:maltose/moltooligosaccharide transporter
MRSRTSSPFVLALYWLGIQSVWGAILGISLQSRSIELSSGNALFAYSRLATIGALVAAGVQIAVGFWSDGRRRNGSRRVEFYVAGAIGGSAALLFFYQASSMASLTLAYIGLQAALNLAIGPYQAIIPDFVDRARYGVASSWMAALQSFGNAVGALAASFIGGARLLAGFLSALLVATCAATSLHARGLPLRDTAEEEAAGSLRVTRPFVDLFISRALVYAGFYTLLGYLLFYVQSVLGIAALADAKRHTGILIISFTVVGALGAALAARPSDRLDKRLVATVGAGAFIVALGLFIATSGFSGAVAATLVAGLGWGIFLVADWAIACRVLPPAAMGTAMGIWNIAILLPQIAAPVITLAVLQRLALTGGPLAPRVAFSLALIETLAGIAWLWRLSRRVVG